MQTELVNSPKRTRMVAQREKQSGTVKIRALLPIEVQKDGKGLRVSPGQEVEIDSEQAEQFCRPVEGSYNFSGERANHEATRHVTRRAEKV